MIAVRCQRPRLRVVWTLCAECSSEVALPGDTRCVECVLRAELPHRSPWQLGAEDEDALAGDDPATTAPPGAGRADAAAGAR